MTKLELSKFARSITLPKGWKVLHVFARDKGGKQVEETDNIYLGQPINEHMSISFTAYNKLIKPVLAQLNKGIKRGQHKWAEFGGGYGSGRYYEIHLGLEYDPVDL